jgi:hypothetical protein
MRLLETGERIQLPAALKQQLANKDFKQDKKANNHVIKEVEDEEDLPEGGVVVSD